MTADVRNPNKRKPLGERPAGKPVRRGGRGAPRGPAGLEARRLAVRLVSAVIDHRRALDDVLSEEMQAAEAAGVSARDRGLARLIASTVLRRHGELSAVVGSFIDKPLPADKGRLWPILLSGAAQLLFLDTPPHAAISLAVEQCRADRGARRFDRLANAVLRRVSEKGKDLLDGLDGARLNVPEWLWARWTATYGEVTARRIIAASLQEAPLDISVKADAEAWAQRLGGVLLQTGSIRLEASGRIEDMPGYHDGAWWVQDAAAALPAKLAGNVAGLDVADLCAAPGGKALELAALGARVTAVDLSEARLARLKENFARMGLAGETVAADAADWDPQRLFDVVLLDAPCTATGTIRRHPDILHLKREGDVAQLAAVQARFLGTAARLVKPGGLLIFCTCSLEPEEGEAQVASLLERNDGFAREPVLPGESGVPAECLSPPGDLRTLPFHSFAGAPATGGMDGFFAARLRRKS